MTETGMQKQEERLARERNVRADLFAARLYRTKDRQLIEGQLNHYGTIYGSDWEKNMRDRINRLMKENRKGN